MTLNRLIVTFLLSNVSGIAAQLTAIHATRAIASPAQRVKLTNATYT